MSSILWDRRNFIAALTLPAATLLWPSFARSQPEENLTGRFGMIEIGSSGVKVAAYEFSRATLADPDGGSGQQRISPNRVGEGYEVNTNVLNDTPESDRATVDTVVAAISRLQTEFGVPADHIAIVMSSGVANEERVNRNDPTYRVSLIGRLEAAISSLTPYELQSVTPASESRLGFDWVVLRPRRPHVLLIDIGSGNTKGGYYDGDGTNCTQFRSFSFDLGTKTFAREARALYPDGPMLDITRQAFDATVAPMLDQQIARSPGMMTRRRVYLVGGIIWAVATLVRSAEMARQPNWVQLSPLDFGALRQRLQRGEAYRVASPPSTNAAQREHLERQVRRVESTFTPDQLAAGIELCQGLSRRLTFQRRDALFFAAFSVNAWSSQYLAEHFSGGSICRA